LRETENYGRQGRGVVDLDKNSRPSSREHLRAHAAERRVPLGAVEARISDRCAVSRRREPPKVGRQVFPRTVTRVGSSEQAHHRIFDVSTPGSQSNSLCPICHGRGTFDTSRMEMLTPPGAPPSPYNGDGETSGKKPDTAEQRIAEAERRRREHETYRSWKRANPDFQVEVFRRWICPACFGLGGGPHLAETLQDVFDLWTLTREECPSRPLAQLSCTRCARDFPVSENLFEQLPLTKRGAQLNNETEAHYWRELTGLIVRTVVARTADERELILAGSSLKAYLYCTNETCGVRYRDNPGWIPPEMSDLFALTIWMPRGRVAGAISPSRLCQSCGVGEVTIAVANVGSDGIETILYPNSDPHYPPRDRWRETSHGEPGPSPCPHCRGEVTLKLLKPLRHLDHFYDWGEAIVRSRNLPQTPLARNGFVEWTNDGIDWPRLAGARVHQAMLAKAMSRPMAERYQPDFGWVQPFFEQAVKNHNNFWDVASQRERACFEKYSADLLVFRDDLTNPNLCATEEWRRRYLSGY